MRKLKAKESMLPAGKPSMSRSSAPPKGACTVFSQYGGAASACAAAYDYKVHISFSFRKHLRTVTYWWRLALSILWHYMDISVFILHCARRCRSCSDVGEDTVVLESASHRHRRLCFMTGNSSIMLRQKGSYSSSEKGGTSSSTRWVWSKDRGRRRYNSIRIPEHTCRRSWRTSWRRSVVLAFKVIRTLLHLAR